MSDANSLRVGNDICPKCQAAHPAAFDCAIEVSIMTPTPDAAAVTELKPDWRERLSRDECPRCGEPLDTGWACEVTSRKCGFDAFLLVQTEMATKQ